MAGITPKGREHVFSFNSLGDEQRYESLIVAHLARHQLLAYPTETVYGLGGSIHPDAVEALLLLKGRPATKTILTLVSNYSMLSQLGADLSSTARRLADACWPGPLTLVLPTHLSTLHPALYGSTRGIAVRYTSHPLMARLIEAYGGPITSTSANLGNQPTLPDAETIVRQWADPVTNQTLMVLDGGILGRSAPSTVIDCTEAHPRILRQGAISVDALRRIVPDLIETT